MPFATWNTGTNPNDETGDTLRDAFIKLRENFARPSLAVLGDVVPAADRILYYTGSSTAALATLTPFGRSLIATSTAAAARTAIGTTATGSSLLTAATAAAARTAIGATATGDSLLTAADAAAVRALLTVEANAAVASLGLKNLNDADLIGKTVAVNGTATQGASLNWPDVSGVSGSTQTWFNVRTFGAANRVTQIASFGFAPNVGRTFVRGLHDVTWSAWREVQFSDATTTGNIDRPSIMRAVMVRNRDTDSSATFNDVQSFSGPYLATNSLGTQYTGALLTGAGGSAAMVVHASTPATDRPPYGASFVGARTAGSGAAHGAVRAGETLTRFMGVGSDGVDTYRFGGSISFEAVGAFTTTNWQARFKLILSAAGGGTPQTVMTVDTTSGAEFIFNGANPTLSVKPVASGVNGITITDAATGTSPKIAATGSDAVIAVVLEAKGNTQVLLNANGRTAFSAEAEGTADSNVYARGSLGNAVLGANSSSANADFSFQAKGTGRHFFGTGNGWSLRIETPNATVANRISIGGSVAGMAPNVSADGSDTNIDIRLIPKGNGQVITPFVGIHRKASAAQTLATNPNAAVIQFDTAGDFLSAVAWNTSTHRCTPTIAGVYLVTLNAMVSGVASGDLLVAICRNASERARFYYPGPDTSLRGSAISAVVSCNGTSDYIDFRVTATSGGASVAAWAGRSFSIVRLGNT